MSELSVTESEGKTMDDLDANALKELLGDWVGFASVQQKIMFSLIHSLESVSKFTEEKALEISYQFQILSTIASEQTKHLQELTHLARVVQVGSDELEISSISQQLQNTYIESIGSIIEVSKQAVVMACIQDESLQTLTKIERCIREIEQINNKTKYLSLNATIESIRAGEAGQSFQVVANEVRELSNDTQQMAVNIRSQVNDMTTILSHAQSILQDITRIDMNQHITAKEHVDAMVDGLVKKNIHMEKVMGDVTGAMQNFSRNAGQLIMSMQYQDRVKQDIEAVVKQLHNSSSRLTSLITQSASFVDLQEIREKSFDGFSQSSGVKSEPTSEKRLEESVSEVPLSLDPNSRNKESDILLF
jgi:methyl-accepting chemotaxis protein